MKDDDGNWTAIRVCLDARPLNSVTESWAYCMTKTDELLSKVAGARMYSGFDAKSAFHQLPIAEKDRHKTAFWSRDRQYEWCRMAMGFKNANQAWQRVMDEALGDLPFVAVYADDICVFSGAAEMSDAEVFQQHLQRLETVFRRLAKAGIRLAPGKGRMAVRQIAFLGHWVDGEGVFPQHSKVDGVVKMPPPTHVAGLRRFLGMVGYYGKFIEQVAVKRKPLTKLTGKVPWEWGSEQQRAFEQLKADLVSAPVLRNPDWSRPFILHTDFRGAGLGTVLAQKYDEGQEYVVEFASRTYQGAEPNYASYAGDPKELDGRGEFSPEGTVRHAAAFCCATAQSSRQPELSAVIAASYVWPGMVEDVARVKKACPDCDRLQHRAGGTSGRPKAASPLDMQPLPHFGMFYRC
eukprot:jgi/Tetstr1/456564/TSEL_043284.t1